MMLETKTEINSGDARDTTVNMKLMILLTQTSSPLHNCKIFQFPSEFISFCFHQHFLAPVLLKYSPLGPLFTVAALRGGGD